jgi:hypothetical protein
MAGGRFKNNGGYRKGREGEERVSHGALRRLFREIYPNKRELRTWQER